MSDETGDLAELQYAAAGHERPAAVLVIGIISLVVAALSTLGTLAGAMILIPAIAFYTEAGGGATGGFAMPPTPITPAGTLTQADADAIVAAFHAQSAIAPADQKTLAAALLALDVPLSPPADGKWTTAHVAPQLAGYNVSSYNGAAYSSYSLANGGSVNLSGGTVTLAYIDASGGYASATYSPGGATGISTTVTPTFVSPYSPGLSWAAIAAQAVSVAASVGLLGLLVAAGVQMVRGRPSGRTLHLWWAWLKIPAVLLSAVAAVAVVSTMFDGFGLFGVLGGGGVRPSHVVMLVPILLGLVWPITVLCLLRLRSLRAYFEVA